MGVNMNTCYLIWKHILGGQLHMYQGIFICFLVLFCLFTTFTLDRLSHYNIL